MNKASQYHVYIHQESSQVTVGDFLHDNSSIGNGFKAKELLLYQDENGDTNLSKLLATYDSEDYNNNKTTIERLSNSTSFTPSSKVKNDPDINLGEDLPLNLGTTLCLNLQLIDRDLSITESNQVVDQTTFSGFYVKQLVDILRDKGNQRIYRGSKSNISSIKEVFPHFSVWVWSRTMSTGIRPNVFEHKIINLTPYVTSIDTGNTASGGNFSFGLASLTCSYVNGEWVIDKGTLKHAGESIVGSSFLHSVDDNGDIKRNNFFHELVLQQNDIVFISFEALQLEGKRKRLQEQEFISPTDLPNCVFDMIGLIDSASNKMNPSTGSVEVVVEGRDLIKTVIEDGIYFYPQMFTRDGIFGNIKTGAGDEYLERFGAGGEYKSRFQEVNRTISRSLKFLINALGQIRIAPDSLFDAYQYRIDDNGQKYDARSRNFKLTTDNQQKSEQSKVLKGVWQIIKLVVDKNIANRRVVDMMLGNEQGSMLNALQQLCHQPFVEFFSDTYGDQFYFIVRKPPFDKESIVSILENRVNIKVIEDEIDATSTTPLTLLEFQNKDLTLKGTNIPQQIDSDSSVIIDIEEVDVERADLDFDTTAYSWYRVQSPNLSGARQSEMDFAYIKAVFFKEYADMFGAKPYDISSNYTVFYQDRKNAVNTAYMIRQGLYDLRYLIQSHAYLPFSRRGAIILSNGDRRIKRGTYVRLKSTRELCYVDSVRQVAVKSNLVSRSTVLQVSRCLKEEYINPKPSFDGRTYSYFDLINTYIDESMFTNMTFSQSKCEEMIANNWKVNTEVFNFFVRRLQFTEKRSDYDIDLQKAATINPVDSNVSKLPIQSTV